MDYSVNNLRRMYLEFFESKGHLKMDSFSLVPKNDNSLLLINAGMAPLKPYFTGEEIPPRTRVTTCQKCVRTGDIENVGKTARHLTFFEMLGNFSFGDYFKEEAIHWSWEFLTEVLKMDKERLYVTIYENDDEAFKIWNEEIGVPAEKIMRIGRGPDGKSDNTGPVPAVPALKSTMTAESSTETAPRTSWAAKATASWRSGTMYSPSSRATARAATPIRS